MKYLNLVVLNFLFSPGLRLLELGVNQLDLLLVFLLALPRLLLRLLQLNLVLTWDIIQSETSIEVT